MIKILMNKVCLLAASLSLLVVSLHAVAQSDSAGRLVPIISLLFEEDPCITAIHVGDVVLGELDAECPSQGRSNRSARYFAFNHVGGSLYIDLISDCLLYTSPSPRD